MLRKPMLLGACTLSFLLLAQPGFATTHKVAPPVAWTAAQAAPQAPAEAASADEEEVDPASIEAEQHAIERHHQLTLHQALGLTTLASMVGTLVLGRLIDSGAVPRTVHVASAGLTSGLYLATAGMAVFAPPPALTSNVPTGWDSVTVHRALAWGHAAGMTSTVGLGLSSVLGGTSNPVLHGWLGITTTVLMTLSAGGILLAQ